MSTILKPLFDFEAIVDFNLSVVHMVRDEFWTDKYFDPDIAIRNEYFLKCALICNKDFNPLKILLRPEYSDSADNIYKSLLEEDILEEYYEFFPTGGLVTMYASNSFTNVSVLCHSKKQVDYCKKLYPERLGISTILRKPDEKVNINKKYDCYFTNNIRDIKTKLDNPEGLQFRVMRARYNIEDKDGIEMPLMEIALPLSNTCTFGLVDPYTDIIVPLKEEK